MTKEITGKQDGLVRKLCAKRGADPEAESLRLVGRPYASLDASTASTFIDHLLVIKYCAQIPADRDEEARRAIGKQFDRLNAAELSVLAKHLAALDREVNGPKREYYASARAGFTRTNKDNACPVCGKKKFCSQTSDKRFAVCTKESRGSFMTTRQGHFVHALVPIDVNSPPARRHDDSAPQPARVVSPADEEERVLHLHAVYTALIKVSPASLAPDQLIHSEGGLAGRLLAPLAHEYGYLPADPRARTQLAMRVAAEARASGLLPERRVEDPLRGVPGFWRDGRLAPMLWSPQEQKGPALVVPYADRGGRIHGCQLRVAHAQPRYRYQWLTSTSYEKGGASPGAPIHVVASTISDEPLPAAVTEGRLKAETSARLLKGHTMIATTGVTCSHELIAAECEATTRRRHHVIVAFDSDHEKNKDVCYHLARLIHTLIKRGLEVKILTWPILYKGLDDVLLAARAPGSQIPFYLRTPRQWYACLPEDPPAIREFAMRPFESDRELLAA